ncbi:MAG: hypothetical protein ACXW29_03105 [Thermoanaerobaculia bacterium]
MTASEERRRELDLRIGRQSRGTLLSLVFFVLTGLAVVATFLLFDALSLPKGWLTAIICIAVAEVLIRRFHFAGRGVESALWLGGLFAFIFGLPSEGRPEGLLLFAAACAIAGARVRNPLIGALWPVFAIAYLGLRHWYIAALLFGIIIAAIALLALAREWQRPSTEVLLVALMMASLIGGAWWAVAYTSPAWSLAWIAFAVAAFTLGIRFRHRGALFGGALAMVIATIVLREMFDFPLQWELILAGALLFAIAAAISRVLRGKTTGFVVTPVESSYEEALRLIGTTALAPQVGTNATPEPVGGGGKFGGAGATGDF